MISFLVPSHNYGRYLGRCIRSILKNNSKYIKEIIVVNDASTDNTDEVIAKINSKKIKLNYYKKNFKNLSKTMNYAVKQSKGNLLCKIDPDDEIKKNFAEILCKKFYELNSDFLYSNFIEKNTSSNKKKIKIQKVIPFLRRFQYPHGSGCLFKKLVWKEVKGYNEKNFYQDDYDFWLKILNKKKFQINYCNESLYVYNKHNTNMSKNLISKNMTKVKIFFNNLFV